MNKAELLPKRVLFLINSVPPDYGGGYLRVFRIASRFKQYGCFYKIATFTKRKVYNEILGVSKDDMIFLSGKFFIRFFEMAWRMIRHSSEYDVLYIASATRYSVLPALIAKIQHKKVVNSVTLSMVDSPALPPSNVFKIPYFWYKNIQFKIADFVFVNSPFLVEECVNYGLKRERVKLINNPVDVNKFHPVVKEDKFQIRKDFGFPEDSYTILFVGSINKRKGCDILPSLFEQLFSRLLCKITFIMCGQKGYPETDEIISKLERLFYEHHNTFVVNEEVKDPSVFYQMSDVFLFPTTNEGMPNVVLEAMATKCMVLCNLLPGITDYALPEVCLVNNNDIISYVEKLVSYNNNQEMYKNEIERNYELINTSFTIPVVDDIIKSYMNV